MSTPSLPASASLLTSVRKSASILLRGRFHLPNQCADVADGLARFLADPDGESVILLQTSVSTTRSQEGSKCIHVVSEESKTVSELKTTIDKRLNAENEPVTLVVRSLDGLLAQFEVNLVYRLITSLIGNKKVGRVLALELNRSAETDSFASLFQTVISVKSGQSDVEAFECFVKHKPDIGKPTSARETFTLDASGNVENVKRLQKREETKKIESQTTEDKDERAALNKLASFNLGLKEGEKTARDKVVLPFWKEEQKVKVRAEEEGEGEVRINKKKEEPAGLIHYEPDDGDDWDEEDPDDDLDF